MSSSLPFLQILLAAVFALPFVVFGFSFVLLFFFLSLVSLHADHETESVELLQDFYALKKKTLRMFELSKLPGGPPPDVELVQSLKQDVVGVRLKLMELEMEQAEQLNEVLNEFELTHAAITQKFINKIATTFRALSDVSSNYVSNMHALR